jgi:hypothetical protein
MRRACLLLFVLAACSSRPPRGGGGGGGAPLPGDAGVAPGDGDAGPASTTMTRAECERFLEHVLALNVQHLRAAVPADEVPTDEQLARIRAELAAELMEPCLHSERAEFACILAAGDLAAARACGG